MTGVARIYRPDETRQRLIDTGLRLFGVAGREGVSTRQLAEAAEVSLNAIQYHFGGKDEVYLAVAKHLVESTGAEMRAAADDAIACMAQGGQADAVESLSAVLQAVVRTILGAPDAACRGGFILREQLQPTAAFDILHAGFVDRLHKALAVLIGRALGVEADAPATIIRAHAVLGQALVFGVARETLSRRLGHGGITAADLALILGEVDLLARDALAGAAARLGSSTQGSRQGDER